MVQLTSKCVVISLLLATGAVSSAIPDGTPTYGSGPARVSTVYEFPTGAFIENLDQRRSGEVLANQLTKPYLWQVDPRKPASQQPVLAATIPGKTGLVGITEIADDVFAVIGGNFTPTAAPPPMPQPGTFSIFTVDFNKKPAPVQKLVDVPGAQLLNGMDFVSNSVLKSYPKGLILATDSFLAALWSINPATKEVKIWAKDPLMVACGQNAGINGVKFNYGNNRVYFANSGCQGGFLASMPIDTKTGLPAGAASVVGGKAQGINPDDFDIDYSRQKAYVASINGQADVVDLDDGDARVLAGAINSSVIPRASSVRLGRTYSDKKQGLFYVSTGGVYAGKVVGGSILAVHK